VLEPTRAVIHESDGPRNALRTMNELFLSAAIVTNRERQVVGMITDRDALKLVQLGESTITSKIQPLESVNRDTPLIDLFVPSVESPLPVTVTDEEHRLLGVIPRVTLLAALASTTPPTEEMTVLSKPLPGNVVDAALQGAGEEN